MEDAGLTVWEEGANPDSHAQHMYDSAGGTEDSGGQWKGSAVHLMASAPGTGANPAPAAR